MNFCKAVPVRGANELQCQMKIFVRNPARARQPRLQLGKRIGDNLGERQGNKETIH